MPASCRANRLCGDAPRVSVAYGVYEQHGCPDRSDPKAAATAQRHGLTATTFAEAAALIAQATSARLELQTH
jgi:hypothetical protein